MQALRARLAYLVTSLVTGCATYSGLESSQPTLLGDEAGAAGSEMASAGTSSGGTSSGGTSASSGTGGAATMGGSNNGAVGGATASDAGAPDSAGASPGGNGNNPIIPTGLTLGTDTTDLTKAPDPDGTVYSDRCPSGQVVIGFYGTVDPSGNPGYLRSEQAICGIVGVSASEPWAVTVTDANPLPMHDIEFGEKQTAKCPLDQVVIGFGGRSGLWMDSVDVRCAPLKILGSSPNFLLVAGTPKTAGTVGGNTGGSPFDPLDCDPGSVAVGQVGNTAYSGDVLGTFGVLCAAVSLETGPG